MRRLNQSFSAIGYLLAALLYGCVSMPTMETTSAVETTSRSQVFDMGSDAAKPKTGHRAVMAFSVAPRSGKDPSGIEAAVRQALNWHPSITERIERLNQQNQMVEQARAGYLPRVNWGVKSPFENDFDDDVYQPTISLSASQMIYDFGKIANKVKLERASVEGRKSQVLLQVDELIRATALAVTEVRRTLALDEVSQDQIRDTGAILELVRARADKGASTRTDQLQAEARVEAAQSKRLEIDAQARRWRSKLENLTGSSKSARSVSMPWPVPKWLDEACAAGPPDWLRIPAIMQADAERSAAIAQIALSKAEGLPTISLDAGVGLNVMEIGEGDPEYTIGLNVKGNLYNGGATTARRRAADLALRASAAASDRVRVEIEGELLAARGQIASYGRLLASLTAREAMMKETRDLYEKQYVDLGTRILLDLLNADQEFHAARFDAVNIRYDLQKLNVECAFVTGRLRHYLSLKGEQLHGVRF